MAHIIILRQFESNDVKATFGPYPNQHIALGVLADYLKANFDHETGDIDLPSDLEAIVVELSDGPLDCERDGEPVYLEVANSDDVVALIGTA